MAAELFLCLNGHELVADDTNCVITMLGVATGEVSEDALAAWLRPHRAPQT